MAVDPAQLLWTVREPLVVTGGKVDVFALREDGYRLPLFSRGPGQGVLPLPGGIVLLAVPRQDSALEPTSPGPETEREFRETLAHALGAEHPIAESLATLAEKLGQQLRESHGTRGARARVTTTADQQLLETLEERLRYAALQLNEPDSPLGEDKLTGCLRRVGREVGVEVVRPPDRDLAGARNPLDRILRASRAEYRTVRLRGDWEESSSPLLGFLRSGQGYEPVALLPGRRGFRLQRDGEHRPRLLGAAEREQLDPVAVEILPSLPPDRPVGLAAVLRLALHGNYGLLLGSLGLGLGVTLVSLFTPFLTRVTMSFIVPQGARPLLLEVGLGLVLAAALGAVLALSQNFHLAAWTQRSLRRVQLALWTRLFALPARFFRQYSSGDLTMRSLSIDQVAQMLSVPVLSALLSATFAVVYVAQMAAYNVLLAGAALLLLLTSFLYLFSLVRRSREISMTYLNGLRDANSWLVQMLEGAMKIRMTGAEDRLAARYLDRARRYAIATARETVLLGRMSAAFALFSGLSSAVFLTVIAWIWTGDASPIGPAEFLAFTAAFGLASGAVNGLSQILRPLAMTRAVSNSIQPILETVPESAGALQDPGQLEGQIELRHLSFRYGETGPLILRDINLSIPPGEMVALVGPSGSGKSTLQRLLLGFETPESGQVLLDGRDLRNLDPQLVRQQVGTVLQASRVERGSILENIVGRGEALEARAWEAAEQAAIADDIRAMPMQMRTIIEPGNLSGGQAQRILLARAIAHRPPLLLLDEATSALDNESQQRVTNSLDRLRATRVVVAHRLSTIRNADQIVVLRDGSIAEIGKYDELLARDALFAALMRRQQS